MSTSYFEIQWKTIRPGNLAAGTPCGRPYRLVHASSSPRVRNVRVCSSRPRSDICRCRLGVDLLKSDGAC